MKRVQKLIVGTQYAPQATVVDHVNLGADGDVGVFNTATGAVAVPGDAEVTIAVRCSDSDGRPYVEQSLPIPIGNISTARPGPFLLSSPKQVDVDLSAVPAPSAGGGEVYEIFVTDYNDYNYIIGRRRIEYEAKAGDVLADVVTGLITNINDDVSLPNLIASYSNDDKPTDPAPVDPGDNIIKIIGKAVGGSGASNVINNFRADYEILFEIILGENLFGLAVNTVTLPQQGCGTFREVRKLEEIHKGYKGHLNRVIFNTSTNIQYKSMSPAQGVAGYDLYTIEWKSPQYTETEGDVHFQIAHTIAVNEADAQAFELFFDTLLYPL